MRGSLRFAIVAVLALGGLWAREARAGSCDHPLVSACVNSDTFWPNAGPSRFASLGGTQTTARNQFSFGLITTYQLRPIVVAIPSPGPTGSKQNAVNDQVTGNFVFGYGVADRLQLHVALPVTFAQGGSGTSTITGGDDLRDTAMRDLRFGMALAVLPERRVDPEVTGDKSFTPSLALRFDVSAPTGDKSQFASDPSAVFAPAIAFGARVDRFFATVDAGLRLRSVSQFAGARVGTQATVGLGLGASILAKELLAVTLEARALPTFTEQSDVQQTGAGLVSKPNGVSIMPAEWMLGVRSAPAMGGDFVLTAGGGTGLPIGDASPTRPRVRALLGVAYAPRGYDSDGDGVLDRDDACPGVAGIKSVPANATTEGAKNPPRRGCPTPREEESAPVDFVGTPPPGAKP